MSGPQQRKGLSYDQWRARSMATEPTASDELLLLRSIPGHERATDWDDALREREIVMATTNWKAKQSSRGGKPA